MSRRAGIEGSTHADARSGANPVPDKLLDLLEQDRVWCAYALADLEPERVRLAQWWIGRRAALIVFRGLQPAWLTVHGDPAEASRLAAGLPPGEYQYALLASHRARLPRLNVRREAQMWRMALRPADFPGRRADAERLGSDHAGELVELFADHPDRPDAFDPPQLEDGVFFGIRQEGRLVAVTGTHVVGHQARVAAIGNVFTHPAHRGRGYGRATGAAVVEALAEAGIKTIVLNVAMANEPALELYRSLGFWPFCGYYEGVGEFAAG